MAELSTLEQRQLAVYTRLVNKFLRLSSERDMYNFSQAAFRLGISRHELENQFIHTGKIKKLWFRNKWWITKTEIENFIENGEYYVSKKSLQMREGVCPDRKARVSL
jgi:hypothetical protein